jgi:hypothetical protein
MDLRFNKEADEALSRLESVCLRPNSQETILDNLLGISKFFEALVQNRDFYLVNKIESIKEHVRQVIYHNNEDTYFVLPINFQSTTSYLTAGFKIVRKSGRNFTDLTKEEGTINFDQVTSRLRGLGVKDVYSRFLLTEEPFLGVEGTGTIELPSNHRFVKLSGHPLEDLQAKGYNVVDLSPIYSQRAELPDPNPKPVIKIVPPGQIDLSAYPILDKLNKEQ